MENTGNMGAISIQEQGEQVIIKLLKSDINVALIERLLQQIRLQYLLDKAEFDEDSLLQLSGEIKADWWAKNGEAFLARIKR